MVAVPTLVLTASAEDLARRVARAFLDDAVVLVTELSTSTDALDQLRSEPSLWAEAALSAEVVLRHWAGCMAQGPCAQVPPILNQDVLNFARGMYRRGLDQELMATYRCWQDEALLQWMRTAFALSSEPAAVAQVVDVGSRSLSLYVNAMLYSLSGELQQQRAELTQSSHAQRFETVSLVLEGAPISADLASARLGYNLNARHTAAILWQDPSNADQAALSRAAEAMARAAGVRQSLKVMASSSSLWFWQAAEADVEAALIAGRDAGGSLVRVAVGSAGAGVDGFSRSHLHAVATQRLMVRHPDVQVAKFDDVQLVTLATQDEQRAAEFAGRTLGNLASAGPDLRDTLRAYIREEYSASRAAQVLYTHRNTVLNRLHRAEELLPIPLAGNGLRIGVALEIAHWLDAAPRKAARRVARAAPVTADGEHQ